ncbi:hypothetical protein OJF2_28210 [Aquisphaera giovannonii]|uniref:Uncharacterized protein n=1 Tax=Aquisphaera giovannonii TaxID=406548 RepID=A0A5B9W0Y6_9BACT|nr:hypothetical protein OJF2_28210 [Aquisphaera giovannonii]
MRYTEHRVLRPYELLVATVGIWLKFWTMYQEFRATSR